MSIVDAKYRGHKANDFVTQLIEDHATKTKEVKTKTKVEGSDEEIETTTVKPDGVDVDKLFDIAAANNIDVAKYNDQRESAGFPGRFRMTLSNMLRAQAKQRHGLFAPDTGDGKAWTPAPADWLASKDAPKEPTMDREGVKFPKPAKEKASNKEAEPA